MRKVLGSVVGDLRLFSFRFLNLHYKSRQHRVVSLAREDERGCRKIDRIKVKARSPICFISPHNNSGVAANDGYIAIKYCKTHPFAIRST